MTLSDILSGGLLSSLLLVEVNYIADAPVWLKIIALTLTSIAALLTIVLNLIEIKEKYEKNTTKKGVDRYYYAT